MLKRRQQQHSQWFMKDTGMVFMSVDQIPQWILLTFPTLDTDLCPGNLLSSWASVTVGLWSAGTVMVHRNRWWSKRSPQICVLCIITQSHVQPLHHSQTQAHTFPWYTLWQRNPHGSWGLRSKLYVCLFLLVSYTTAFNTRTPDWQIEQPLWGWTDNNGTFL